METYTKPVCDQKTRTNHADVYNGQRRNEIECSLAPKRYQHRTNDFSPGREQVDAGRIFPHEYDKEDHPACQDAIANQWQRNLCRIFQSTRGLTARHLA
jgi:hypothetical protein